MIQRLPATLYYIHDPMCSWCWGFRQTWMNIKRQLPDDVKLVSWVGGLAADSDEPMAANMQQYLQQTWQRIQQKIPGTQFNFDYWLRNTPRRSTYPACRAVIAARELANLEDQMTFAIQQAYYLQAKNPSDLETLIEAASSIGLERKSFTEKMLSSELQQSLEKELSEVHDIGVNSFPGVLMQTGSKRQNIHLDYNSADEMLREINLFLADVHD